MPKQAGLTRWRPRKGLILDRRAGFFAALSTIYLVVLTTLLLARQFHWLGVDRLSARIGGIIPLAIPWFGALGAVTASLYGVFDHNGECSEHRHPWDCSYNYWHLLRPLMGAVLGTVSYLIFVGFVNATTAGTTGVSRIPTTAEQAIPYLVIAFVVGYREDTFRKLIKTIIDTILGPGIPGLTPPAGISISPSPVDFGDVPVNTPQRKVVTVSNTGAGNLVIHGAQDMPPGVSAPDPTKPFTIEDNTVSGAVIPPGGQATMSVVFKPTASDPSEDTITITSNAGARTIQLSGTGTQASNAPAETAGPGPIK